MKKQLPHKQYIKTENAKALERCGSKSFTYCSVHTTSQRWSQPFCKNHQCDLGSTPARYDGLHRMKVTGTFQCGYIDTYRIIDFNRIYYTKYLYINILLQSPREPPSSSLLTTKMDILKKTSA